jgi:DNA-binding CsgD family transcriptional regulator
MARLSGSDYRKVLDVMAQAADVHGSNPFPEPVLEALRRLVPCDVVTYHTRAVGGVPAIARVGDWRSEWTPELRAIDARTWDQDGLVPSSGARKISDLLSPRQWHRLELYQDASRPLGIEHMMRLWLDPEGEDGARLEFDREAHDFGERDRTALDLLRPHLDRFRRRARRRGNAEGRSSDALTPREREVIELVAEGKTNGQIGNLLWISPGTVRKHLENAYEKLGVHTRTGAVAALRASTGRSDG